MNWGLMLVNVSKNRSAVSLTMGFGALFVSVAHAKADDDDIGLAVLPLIWVGFALIPAFIAKSKGKSFENWFIYGALLWPIATLHAIGMTTDKRVLDERAVAEGKLKRCDQCKEAVQKAALVCPYCGHKDLAEQAIRDRAAEVIRERSIYLDGKSKTCAKCRRMLSSKAQKCDRCGSDVSKAPIQVIPLWKKIPAWFSFLQ
jgi:RNA polymerase subunit RPABC4/transcription elongation factor Spt4